MELFQRNFILTLRDWEFTKRKGLGNIWISKPV